MFALDSELCRLMKEKAPAEDVEEMFNELYPDQREQFYDLFVCYVVHYDYHDVDIDIELLMNESEFSPFLTAAHERKPEFFPQEKLRQLHDNLTVFCKIFTAAYGIFEEDTMQKDRKMIITDIIFARDDIAYLEPYLVFGAKPERPLLVHAARYGAKSCCEMLAKHVTRYRDADIIDPTDLLTFFLKELTNICDITVENSLCAFNVISKNLPGLSFPHLSENDKENIRKFNGDIDMIIDSLRSPSDISTIQNRLQSVPLGCDLKLFRRLFMQSCESLLQVLKQQSSELFVIPKGIRNLHSTLLLHMYMPILSHNMPQERLWCGIKLMTRVTKLMLRFGMQPPEEEFKGNHFTQYDEIISVNQKDGISERIVELFRVQLVYGWIQLEDDCDWQWLQPKKIVTDYPDCMVKAIQEAIGLLPREIYDRLRSSIMTKVNQLAQEERSDYDEEAKYQEMFAIYRMWFKKECRTLNDLCRNQLYQILPRGQVPIFAMQPKCPEPLRDYLTLETDKL